MCHAKSRIDKYIVSLTSFRLGIFVRKINKLTSGITSVLSNEISREKHGHGDIKITAEISIFIYTYRDCIDGRAFLIASYTFFK